MIKAVRPILATVFCVWVLIVVAATGCSGVEETEPGTTATDAEPAAAIRVEVQGRFPSPTSYGALRAMSSDVLVAWVDGQLCAFFLPWDKPIYLPTESWECDVDGDLIVWVEDTESQHAVYAYHLPDRRKIKIAESDRWLSKPRVDDGRVFWIETTSQAVTTEPGRIFGATCREECAIQMLRIDDEGHPRGTAVQVTDRPNSIHWVGFTGAQHQLTYDVYGSRLVFERMWGEETGVHLLDLESGGSLYLGEGRSPSVSASLVTWEGPTVWGTAGIWALDHATGSRSVLVTDGFKPLAGPGYVLYTTDGAVYLLDEGTSRTTLIGEYLPGFEIGCGLMLGSDSWVAWETNPRPGELCSVWVQWLAKLTVEPSTQ